MAAFVPILSLLDLQNIRGQVRKPIPLGRDRLEDYTILIPLFGSPDALTNTDYLKSQREHVLVCVPESNSREMEWMLAKLEREGIRVARLKASQRALSKKWEILKHALAEPLDYHDTVLPEASDLVSTSYVVFLDADSVPQDDLALACGAMARSELDLASVKVYPNRSRTIMEKLQGVEYDIAMLSRNYRPWLTSGACMIARTEVMRVMMAKHSLYYYGGDVEIGMIAMNMKARIGHLDFRVLTDVPPTFLKWARQRIGWWAGSFRGAVTNADKNLHSPVWLLYNLIVVWVLLPVKILILVEWPLTVLLALGLYIPITFVGNWKVRSRWMLAYPVYALVQLFAISPAGIWEYFSYAWKTRNLGRMRPLAPVELRTRRRRAESRQARRAG